jgi:type I restriction enzyme S subunit
MNSKNLKDYILSIESGKRPKGGAVNSGIPSLGGEHINFYGGFNIESNRLKYVPEFYFDDMNKGIIKINDILVVKDGATTGKVAIVTEDFPLKKSCVNEHIFILRVDEISILPKYIFYYLYSDIGQNNILRDFRGATVGGISKNFIDINLYLPTLETQEKMANTLDKAWELVEKRKEQIKDLDELIQSIFYDMFGDPITNPKKWKVSKLGNIAKIIMGQSPKGESYNENGEGEPLINGPVEFGKMYPTERQWTTMPTKFCEKGDILFCVRGATAGKMNFSDKSYCIGRGVAAIKSERLVSTEFIYFVLKVMEKVFQATSNGSTFININKDQLHGVNIFDTGEELQDRFVNIVQNIEKQKELLQQSQKELEDNFNALMQKAFKGELY